MKTRHVGGMQDDVVSLQYNYVSKNMSHDMRQDMMRRNMWPHVRQFQVRSMMLQRENWRWSYA